MISLSQARETHSSEEENEEQRPIRKATSFMAAASATPTACVSLTKLNNNNKEGSSRNAGSITPEVPRKTRGRPPGSKNKPKLPIVITKENESSMQPVVLEIPAASDIIEMVYQFTRKRHVCVSILSASGTVSNVTLRHPTSPNTTLTLPGLFEILSLSGSFLCSSSPPPLTISLAGGQGQVIGGTVAGKLLAVTTVVLMAASFVSPLFYRLPHGDEEAENINRADKLGNTSVGGTEACPTSISASLYNVAAPNPLNCQIPSDAMPWAPTSRPPY